jgi:hypothetical protein
LVFLAAFLLTVSHISGISDRRRTFAREGRVSL